MTIVGQAEIVISPNSAQFNSRLIQGTQYGLTQLGNTAERQATRGTTAFSLMYSTLTTASLGALAPVAGVVSNLQNTLSAVEGHIRGIARAGLIAGGAGTAIGAGLMGLGSQEASNLSQLQGTITNTGHVWSDYSGRIEEAVKSGEHYGHTAANTYDALNRITVATQNPNQALERYAFTLNYAATRHIDLASAAQLVAQAVGGSNSRLFKTLGENVGAATVAVKAQTAAQKAHASALTELAAKQKALRQEEERIAAGRSSGPSPADEAAKIASAAAAVASAQAALQSAQFSHGASSPQATAAADRLTAAQARLAAAHQTTTGSTSGQVSQQIALKNAHDAVAAAQAKVTATTKNLDAANRAAGPAQDLLNHQWQIAAQRVSAGDRSMNSFSGHLHQLGAELEDQTATFANKWGPAITAGSVALLATSTAVDVAKSAYDRFGASGRQAAAMQQRLTDVQKAQGDAFRAQIAGQVAVEESQGILAEVEAELGDTVTTTTSEVVTGTEEQQTAIGEVTASLRTQQAQALETAAAMDSVYSSTGPLAGGMEGMASRGASSMGKLGGAVAGVTAAIGSFAIGSATAGHGAGGGAVATLGGAVSGAVAGLSIGGPWGAAVGAAGGALVGLAGHFFGAGHAASKASKDIDAFTSSLKDAYQADNGRLGQQSRAAINQYLQSPSAVASGLPDLLAQAGVTMNEIIKGIREPGSLKSAAAQVNRAYTEGTITAGDFNKLLDALDTINGQFEGMVNTADDIASINGHVTQHMNDIQTELQKLLSIPLQRHPTTGVTSHAGQGLGGLLSLVPTGSRPNEDSSTRATHGYLNRIAASNERTAHHLQSIETNTQRTAASLSRALDPRFQSPSLSTIR